MLNLYGDGGNVQCLGKRLMWRGIGAEVKKIPAGDAVDFSGLDLVLLGGGSDREQEIACRYLQKEREDFRAYVEDGGVVLAICGGYQLLGSYYKTRQATIKGLHILDMDTEWAPGRLTGNILLESPLSPNLVVGFENHGGRTRIGSHTPFGRVVRGHGNDDSSGREGVLYKNLIGTYLHGPLLPKNPEICDYLLARALERKYGTNIRLEPLNDGQERQANGYMVRRMKSWLAGTGRICYTAYRTDCRKEGTVS